MRVLGFFVLALSSIVSIGPLQSADLPRFRPALPGNGPEALVNQINTQELLKQGQKEGGIMFCCYISKIGNVMLSETYRPMPNSDLLKAEVEKCLKKVRFFPAIYEHQPVDSLFYGTVTFSVIDGKPRLRIYANQEVDEFTNGKDFIGPQPIIGAGSKFIGTHYSEHLPVAIKGLAYLSLKIDAVGNVQEMRVVSEEPASTGLGQVALADFNQAKFIPAFRNGDPTECNILLPVYYQP